MNGIMGFRQTRQTSNALDTVYLRDTESNYSNQQSKSNAEKK